MTINGFLALLPSLLGLVGFVVYHFLNHGGKGDAQTKKIITKLRQNKPETAHKLEKLKPRQISEAIEADAILRSEVNEQDFDLLRQALRQQFILSLLVYGLTAFFFVFGIVLYVYLQIRAEAKPENTSGVSSGVAPLKDFSPRWLPPELPSNCTNVFVSFGDQRLSVPLWMARVSPRKEGTKFLLSELPEELQRDHEKLPGYKPGMSNIFVRIDSAKVTVGERTVDYPILPYVKSNRLFVYVSIPFQTERRMVSMSDDMDSEIPPTWDRNYNTNAFEVVNETGKPVLQVYYRKSNEIQVNGIFIVNTNYIYEAFGGVPWLYHPEYKIIDLATTQEVVLPNIVVSIQIDTNSVYDYEFPNRNAIFKYPGWKFLGQYADVTK